MPGIGRHLGRAQYIAPLHRTGTTDPNLRSGVIPFRVVHVVRGCIRPTPPPGRARAQYAAPLHETDRPIRIRVNPTNQRSGANFFVWFMWFVVASGPIAPAGEASSLRSRGYYGGVGCLAPITDPNLRQGQIPRPHNPDHSGSARSSRAGPPKASPPVTPDAGRLPAMLDRAS